MSNPVWQLVENPLALVVSRVWDDGKQESRLVSSFTPEDPDYEEVQALVAEGAAQ